MERLERAALLLRLVDRLREKGSSCGLTHVQKATYFVQDLMEVPLGFRFVLYKYGPFSFDLRDECSALRADYLLKFDSVHDWGPAMAPTERKEYIDRIFHHKVDTYDRAVEFVAETIGGKGSADLERLGTALFVTLNAGSGRSIEDRCRRVTELKPHITTENARAAVGEIDRVIEASKGYAWKSS